MAITCLQGGGRVCGVESKAKNAVLYCDFMLNVSSGRNSRRRFFFHDAHVWYKIPILREVYIPASFAEEKSPCGKSLCFVSSALIFVPLSFPGLRAK